MKLGNLEIGNGQLTAVGVAVILLMLLGSCGFVMSTGNSYNKDMRIFKAQTGVVEAFHDRMWKTISQKAQITKNFATDKQALLKSSFDAIYPKLISEGNNVERQSTGTNVAVSNGASVIPMLQQLFQSNNIELSSTMYEDLSRSVESLRGDFFTEQKKWVQLAANVNHWVEDSPYSLINGSKPKAEPKIVSSGRSKEAMETGEDNDDGVFTK